MPSDRRRMPAGNSTLDGGTASEDIMRSSGELMALKVATWAAVATLIAVYLYTVWESLTDWAAGHRGKAADRLAIISFVVAMGIGTQIRRDRRHRRAVFSNDELRKNLLYHLSTTQPASEERLYPVFNEQIFNVSKRMFRRYLQHLSSEGLIRRDSNGWVVAETGLTDVRDVDVRNS